jgi:hypothetical protein
MSARAGLSIFVLDVTAVLLILFGFLAAVSGLCLVKPEVVERAALGLFSSYAVCSRLHLGWTALITIVVAVIHGVAGLDVWLLRMGWDWPWLWAAGAAAAVWFIYIYLA